MPLIVDIPEGSVRLNYLFNRLEISHDQRETWSILFEDENDSLGTIDGLTYHRGELFIVTELGVYSSPVSPIDFKLICPQRKGGDMVDIVSFDNMLYACTNNAGYQAASGSRWRLKYEGKGCGHFFSLLNFNGTLLTACEKGVYVASQEGKFWHPRFSSTEFGKFFALDSRDNVLYAQTDKGFFISEDNGQHWLPHPKLVGPWTNAMGGSMIFAPRTVKKQKA